MGASRSPVPPAGHGLARILSKRGICSRTVAADWIRAGRVSVAGVVVLDPERRTPLDAEVEVLGLDAGIANGPLRVLMLNKPRGLVTSRADEKGRPTVYQCLDDPGLPWLAPVGRLDQASEGLLLFATRPDFAQRINHPAHHVPKTYHVQIDCVADTAMLESMRGGIADAGEHLRAQQVELLRRGPRHCWLVVTLIEGRNRQIRRMLAALGVGVVRLVRVAIGDLPLGNLAKGAWRWLDAGEVEALLRISRPR